MTDQTPAKPIKKTSGAANRKRAKERAREIQEAREALLRAQGKLIETDTLGVTFKPRPHQGQLEAAHQRGIRRQAHVWHRRAGKSAATLSFLAKRALERPGYYLYMTPKAVQTRIAIWDSRRGDGIREIDVHFQRDVVKARSEHEMLIELINGSMVKFAGSDTFDRMVGLNAAGIVFDEFALGDPAAWDYLAPVLAVDVQSWAVFISTYRGRNHWYRMFQRVKDDAAWHTSLLTIKDTVREDGKTRIVTDEMVEKERREGKREEYLRQEYFCDPYSGFEGAFYATAVHQMQTDGRIGPVAYDPKLPVTVSVDLGFADELVFVSWQQAGNEHRILASGSWKFTDLSVALDEFAVLYPWGRRPCHFILPHDGQLVAEIFEARKHDTTVLPRTSSVAREIEQVRLFLGRVRIDHAVRDWSENEDNNALLIEALLGYRTTRALGDGDVYRRAAAHTWESHFADAVRYYVEAQNAAGSDFTGTAMKLDYSAMDRIARTIT